MAAPVYLVPAPRRRHREQNVGFLGLPTQEKTNQKLDEKFNEIKRLALMPAIALTLAAIWYIARTSTHDT